MRLPIHGFVLAGGRSSRMGRDKALLPFRGRPMVEIAVSTLASVCEHVSICGNREDLGTFAPVVYETRPGCGPVAGIEAGLLACESEWALFMPVDLPLLPPFFVGLWVGAVIARQGTRASHVSCGGRPHSALCILNRACFAEVLEGIKEGERRVQSLLQSLGGFWMADAAEFGDSAACERGLTNINTPEELDLAEKL